MVLFHFDIIVVAHSDQSQAKILKGIGNAVLMSGDINAVVHAGEQQGLHERDMEME